MCMSGSGDFGGILRVVIWMGHMEGFWGETDKGSIVWPVRRL